MIYLLNEEIIWIYFKKITYKENYNKIKEDI
jgi:hypothetical protein